MGKVIIQVKFEVPEGKYCWKYMKDGHVPCSRMDHGPGVREIVVACLLFRENQRDDGQGYMKVSECKAAERSVCGEKGKCN